MVGSLGLVVDVVFRTKLTHLWTVFAQMQSVVVLILSLFAILVARCIQWKISFEHLFLLFWVYFVHSCHFLGDVHLWIWFQHLTWALFAFAGIFHFRTHILVITIFWLNPIMTKCRRLRYPNRAYSMRTVNHAAGHALLVQIVCFLFRSLCSFGHMLEVQEAAEGIGMSLTLHHLKSLLVLIPFAVHWACPYHHLVCLVVLLAFKVVLVLQLLVMLVLLVVHHHFHLI